jgi:hypothetical protein
MPTWPKSLEPVDQSEIWYKYYVIGGYSTFFFSNFPQSVINPQTIGLLELGIWNFV